MGHRHHRGFYPYPFPVQYPTWGPAWGAERILLVEPDKKKPQADPCPGGFVYNKTTHKCVKKPKGAKALHGLEGVLEDPLNVITIIGAGILGYFLGKRAR